MRGRRAQDPVTLVVIAVIASCIAIGLFAFLQSRATINLYDTVEGVENQFITSIGVSEEARLYVQKATEYALQMAVINVSDQGGLIRGDLGADGRP